jgi:hypothetical protein
MLSPRSRRRPLTLARFACVSSALLLALSGLAVTLDAYAATPAASVSGYAHSQRDATSESAPTDDDTDHPERAPELTAGDLPILFLAPWKSRGTASVRKRIEESEERPGQRSWFARLFAEWGGWTASHGWMNCQLLLACLAVGLLWAGPVSAQSEPDGESILSSQFDPFEESLSTESDEPFAEPIFRGQTGPAEESMFRPATEPFEQAPPAETKYESGTRLERTSLIKTLQHIPGGLAKIFADKPGANYPDRPLWSPAKIKLMDPKDYPHITSLDNDNPNSFWYSYRPNLFNQPIEDEWDWYNLINTQRSDFTDTPFSAGEDVTILETGYTYTRTRGVAQPFSTRTVPEAFLRHGLTDELEIQFKWTGYIDNQVSSPSGQFQNFGTYDSYLGIKYELWQQKNWIPMTTTDIGALVPTGTNGMSGNTVQPHFNITNGWGLRRWLYLKHQFGLDYLTQPSFTVEGIPAGLVGSRQTVDSFHSSVSLMYQATKRVGGFNEWFCQYGHNQPTINYYDTGLFYYFTPNIQLDAVFGTSIASEHPSVMFCKFGFCTRW